MGRRTGSPTVHAPDPTPARRLGALLAEERRCGTGFPTAWTRSTGVVLYDLPPHERRSWSKVFYGTRQTWSAAYAGVPDARRAMFVA